MLARDNENFRTPARIELTTLRILHVYRTFQPLNRRVASSILARGTKIFIVPGEHDFFFTLENAQLVSQAIKADHEAAEHFVCHRGPSKNHRHNDRF